ncbi:sensor histidine kinase [Inmirania thermothiophila]|uniref:histidine kinase n=1 Tax=Inmirania thermothiophila TaxID=1750597 RepID=A0A3N1Y871_9GAMM|nr:ATP-binding protein [Inmirania thermothiophila]ROR34698.1 signal transduction histidine kinase [Inmirania thermothiophila]
MSASSAIPGHPSDPGPRAWQTLLIIGTYRLALAGLLTVLAVTGLAPRTLGVADPALFTLAAVVYLVLALAGSIAFHLRRPAFDTQVHLQGFVDIALITALIHAAGGVSSGLGMLLLVVVIGGGLLLEGRLAVLFAALATLALLAEETYRQLTTGADPAAYPRIGILGAALFATAYLAHVLARRVRQSEALAARRAVDLANLAELNDYIIQRFRSGLLAVDAAQRIRLVNDAAWRLLGMPALGERTPLAAVAPGLAEALEAWRQERRQPREAVRATPGGRDVLPRFYPLGAGADAGTLVVLEDDQVVTEQVQQLKLASLGRLSASIAHEIRNPLGAIAHAAQLLEETEGLDEGTRRLVAIVRDNARRVNTVVENVLQISRAPRARTRPLALAPWLERFAAEFRAQRGLGADDALAVAVEPADLTVEADPDQLHQILWNLCANADEHGRDEAGRLHLTLRAGTAPETGGAFIEVADRGPGILPEVASRIFEPFFSTGGRGTGLGLYIARELAAVAGAALEYRPVPTGGSAFRLRLAGEREMAA